MYHLKSVAQACELSSTFSDANICLCDVKHAFILIRVTFLYLPTKSDGCFLIDLGQFSASICNKYD